MSTRPSGNQRRHERDEAAGRVEIGWTNAEGVMQVVHGTCVDVSLVGMKIEVRQDFRPGSVVYIRSGSLGRDGSARVRYCRRKGIGFRVGVEFTDAPKVAKKPAT